MEIKTAESAGIHATGEDINSGGMQIKTASWDGGGGSAEDRLKKSLDAQTRMLYMELPRSAKKRVLKIYEREMEKAGAVEPESGTMQPAFSSFSGSQSGTSPALSGGTKGGSGLYSGSVGPSQSIYRGRVRSSTGGDALGPDDREESSDKDRKGIIIRTSDSPVSEQGPRTGKKAKSLGIDKTRNPATFANAYADDDPGNVPESGTVELKDTPFSRPEISETAPGSALSHGSGSMPAGQSLNIGVPKAARKEYATGSVTGSVTGTVAESVTKSDSRSAVKSVSQKTAYTVQSEAVSGRSAASHAVGAVALARETVSKPVQSLGSAGRNAGNSQNGLNDSDENRTGYVSDTVSQGIAANISVAQGAGGIAHKAVNRAIERERGQDRQKAFMPGKAGGNNLTEPVASRDTAIASEAAETRASMPYDTTVPPAASAASEAQKSRNIGRESFRVPESGTGTPTLGSTGSPASSQAEAVRSPSLAASQRAVRREASAKSPAPVPGKSAGPASGSPGSTAGVVGNAGMQAVQTLGSAAQSAVPGSSGSGYGDERTDYASNSIGQGISTETGILEGMAGTARDAYDYAKEQIRKEAEIQKPGIRSRNRMKSVTEREASFLEGRGDLAKKERETAGKQGELEQSPSPSIGTDTSGYGSHTVANGEPVSGSTQAAGQKASDAIHSFSQGEVSSQMPGVASVLSPGTTSAGTAGGLECPSEPAGSPIRAAVKEAGPASEKTGESIRAANSSVQAARAASQMAEETVKASTSTTQTASAAAQTAGSAVKAAGSSAKAAETSAKAAGAAAQAAETTAKAAGTAAKTAAKTAATAAEAGTAAATAGASMAAEAAVEAAAMPVRVAEKVNAEIRRQYAAAELALEAGSRLGGDTAGKVSDAGQGGSENKGGRWILIGVIAAVFVTAFMLIIPVFLTASAATAATYTAGAAYSEMEEYGNALAEAAWNELSLGGFGGSTYLNWYNSYGHEISGNWCGVFISYCGYQCGYVGEGVSDSMPFLASCARMKEWYQRKGWYFDADGYIPSAGDIIFYTSGHAGIVYSYDESTLLVRTIEGNVDRADLPAGNGYLKSESYRSIYSTEIEGYACPALSLLE